MKTKMTLILYEFLNLLYLLIKIAFITLLPGCLLVAIFLIIPLLVLFIILSQIKKFMRRLVYLLSIS